MLLLLEILGQALSSAKLLLPVITPLKIRQFPPVAPLTKIVLVMVKVPAPDRERLLPPFTAVLL